MRGIQLQVAAQFAGARSVRLGQSLAVKRNGRYGEFVLPKLELYDVIVLQ
jgi:hypothetical protein